MSKYNVQPTGNELFFEQDEIIVSKTDLKGRITYANDVFQRIAGFTESELMGQPHSIIRHPAMPRSIFKFLWDTIETKKELFAYVINMAKNGDHYWVLAHVSASLDEGGNLIGYHSNRRVPSREAVQTVSGIYETLLAVENQHTNAKQGLDESFAALVATVQGTGMEYDQLVTTF